MQSVTEQASAGYRFVQDDGALTPTGEPQVMEDVGRMLADAGCTPADIAHVTPDAGFHVVYVRGKEMVLYKEPGADGFAVQVVTVGGEGVLPSDKAAHFGADAVDPGDVPGLEGIDLGAMDQEFIGLFDVNGDGALSMGDIIEYDDIVRELDLEEADEIDLDSDKRDRMRDTANIDGDADWGTDEDRRRLVETLAICCSTCS